jgi:NO-binding membrane sensor protein with MHYT domain
VGTVAEVHHFAYGWINPTLAFVMSFLGSLLGLVLAGRAREVSGVGRVKWLSLAAVALGGTGIWLMHFMAMLGFDVPGSVVRYSVPMTFGSVLIAVVIVALGLFAVGFGELTFWKVGLGGSFTGVGVAAMHYTGMAAMHTAGTLSFDPLIVGLSVLIAVVASMVALWFAVVIRGASATVGAALLMGVAVCSMHYTGMAAVRVHLAITTDAIPGVSPFLLLTPISILACVVISALAYSTVGFSVQQENHREEVALAQARDMHEAAALLGPRVGARHR